MIIERTHSFEKEYKKLAKEVQDEFLHKISLMEQQFNHPSLRIKKIAWTHDVYEASISQHFMFTFQFIQGGIILRNIGKKDEILGRR